jgi:hypothetical protein
MPMVLGDPDTAQIAGLGIGGLSRRRARSRPSQTAEPGHQTGTTPRGHGIVEQPTGW